MVEDEAAYHERCFFLVSYEMDGSVKSHNCACYEVVNVFFAKSSLNCQSLRREVVNLSFDLLVWILRSSGGLLTRGQVMVKRSRPFCYSEHRGANVGGSYRCEQNLESESRVGGVARWHESIM